MSTIAEFEEKEFEHAFSNQLKILKPNSWAPGQVLENTLGFDGAFFTVDPFILNLFFGRRYFFPRRTPHGFILDRELIREFSREIDTMLPPLRFNFFAQHKRPEYVEGEKAQEREKWGQPYYRYRIQAHQQTVLSKLEQVSDQSALVLYCCPAFHKKEALYHHMKNGSLIQKTNYVKPSKLDNHSKYTFIREGSHGWAFSEPEEIEGNDFKSLLYQYEELPLLHTSDLILKAGKLLEETFSTIEYKEHDLTRQIIKDMMQHVDFDYYQNDRYAQMAKALAHIAAMRFVHGTSLVFVA